MLPVLIVLSLISLLVATEADPSGSPVPPPADPPLRPGKRRGGDGEPKQDRLAA